MAHYTQKQTTIFVIACEWIPHSRDSLCGDFISIVKKIIIIIIINK